MHSDMPNMRSAFRPSSASASAISSAVIALPPTAAARSGRRPCHCAEPRRLDHREQVGRHHDRPAASVPLRARHRVDRDPRIDQHQRVAEREREMRGEGEARRAIERHDAQDRVAGLQPGDRRAGAGRVIQRLGAVHHALGHAGGARGEADQHRVARCADRATERPSPAGDTTIPPAPSRLDPRGVAKPLLEHVDVGAAELRRIGTEHRLQLRDGEGYGQRRRGLVPGDQNPVAGADPCGAELRRRAVSASSGQLAARPQPIGAIGQRQRARIGLGQRRELRPQAGVVPRSDPVPSALSQATAPRRRGRSGR